MKRIIALGIAAILSAAAVAEPVDMPTGALDPGSLLGSTQNNLLIAGPLQSYNAKTGTAVILGQTVPVAAQSLLDTGFTATVLGTINSSGSFSVSSIGVTGAVYVPGCTLIFLSGAVEKVNHLLDQITVGGVTVALGSAENPPGGLTTISVGTTVQIVGTQPVIGGEILAQVVNVGNLRPITSASPYDLQLFEEATLGETRNGIGITGTGNIRIYN